MLIRKGVYIFIFVFISINIYSQRYNKPIPDDGKYVAVIADYYGVKQNTFAIGIGIKADSSHSFGKPASKHGFGGFSAFYERSLNDKHFWGTSTEFWFGTGPAVGLNVNYHQNNLTQIYGFRPSIGWSYMHLVVMYGYNFYKKNDNIPELRHHIFTVRLYVPVLRKK